MKWHLLQLHPVGPKYFPSVWNEETHSLWGWHVCWIGKNKFLEDSLTVYSLPSLWHLTMEQIIFLQIERVEEWFFLTSHRSVTSGLHRQNRPTRSCTKCVLVLCTFTTAIVYYPKALIHSTSVWRRGFSYLPSLPWLDWFGVAAPFASFQLGVLQLRLDLVNL